MPDIKVGKTMNVDDSDGDLSINDRQSSHASLNNRSIDIDEVVAKGDHSSIVIRDRELLNVRSVDIDAECEKDD